MMKRFVALLLMLVLLCQNASVWNSRAHARAETPEIPQNELAAEMDTYGSVEAALDAYAMSTFERYYRHSLDRMLAPEANNFRQFVYQIEGTDDDPNWILRYLMSLGYRASDTDSMTDEQETALFLKYLLILAEMDNADFEKIKKNVAQYMPEHNLVADTLSYAVKLVTLGADKYFTYANNTINLQETTKLHEYINATGAQREILRKAYHAYVANAAAARKMLKFWNGATNFIANTKEYGEKIEKTLDGAKIEQVTNAYEKSDAGLRMLESIAPQNFDNADFARAFEALYTTYLEYQAELAKLSADDEGQEKLNDPEYLDRLFRGMLEDEIKDISETVVVMLQAFSVDMTADLLSGGLATLITEGSLLLGEWFLGTKSMYTHMHELAVVNEIYEELVESNQRLPMETWSDYYTYAENIKRMCHLSMLGEQLMYDMLVEDSGLFLKMYNKIAKTENGKSKEQYTKEWYEIRVYQLENMTEQVDEYLASIIQHHTELLSAEADMTPYLGHEDESTATLSGILRQGDWFAKTDGSGKPDLENPNPDKGSGAHDVQVVLLADGVKIAETISDLAGNYTLTYDRMQAEGKALTLQFAPKGNGKYAEKTIDAATYVNFTFPSGYGWNSTSETPEDAATWSASVQVPYSDWHFIAPGSGKYSQELALSSLGLAAASMSRSTADGTVAGSTGRDANIRSALAQMGYNVMQTANYDTNLNDVRDGIPFALGTKAVEEPDPQEGEKAKHRIVVLAVGGDVDVPAMTRGWYDDALEEASAEICRSLLSCISSVWNEDTEQLHLWLTGFSWGGTVADDVLDELWSRQQPLSGSYDVELYTFGAFGDLNAHGNHLVYQHDLIGRGLTKDSTHQIVFSNVELEAPAHNLVSSIYHELTYGNAPYSPYWFETNTLLKDTLRQIDAPKEDLHDLLAAMVARTFINSADGTDFRMHAPEDRSAAVRSLLGYDADWSDAQAQLYAGQALDQVGLPIFAATPDDYTRMFQNILADVIVLDAAFPEAESAFNLPDSLKPHAFQLLLQVDDALYNPTNVDSLAFAHHPEMYFAWLLGTDASSLTGAAEDAVYHAELLPLPINLQGTVLDEKTHRPLSGVTVTITGNGTTQVHTTNSQGKWATYVDPADYRITFECSGYKSATEKVTRGRFGDEAVTLETLMDDELPYLSAFVDRRNNGPVQALTKEGDCPDNVPEVTLSMTMRNSAFTQSVIITHEHCAEPLTYDPPASYESTLYAVDMGNGSYTYILNAHCNGTGGGSYVLVFRVVDGEFVIIKEFVSENHRDGIYADAIFLDNSTCEGTIYPLGVPFKVAEIESVGDKRTGIRMWDPDLGDMVPELREDGYYDLIFSLGTRGTGNYDYIGDVNTRYTMVDGEMVMTDQWFKPYHGVLVSAEPAKELEVAPVSPEEAIYLVRARRPGDTLYGYVDIRSGKFAVSPQYTSCDTTFCNDPLSIVHNELGQCNVINEKGEKLFEDGEIVTAMEFYDDTCLVVQRDQTHCYLYDANGNEVMELTVPVDNLAELYPTDVVLGWSSGGYGRKYRAYTPEKYILLRATDQNGDTTEHWLNEKGEILFSAPKKKIPGSLADDESGFYYFYKNRIESYTRDLQLIDTVVLITEPPMVNWDGDNWYARVGRTVYTNGLKKFSNARFSAGGYDIDANDGVISSDGYYFNSDGTELKAVYLNHTAYYHRNGYVKWEDGYGDAAGNIIFAFPAGSSADQFSSVLPGGYFLQKEGSLYGIKHLDGTVICEPIFSELYSMD